MSRRSSRRQVKKPARFLDSNFICDEPQPEPTTTTTTEIQTSQKRRREDDDEDEEKDFELEAKRFRSSGFSEGLPDPGDDDTDTDIDSDESEDLPPHHGSKLPNNNLYSTPTNLSGYPPAYRNELASPSSARGYPGPSSSAQYRTTPGVNPSPAYGYTSLPPSYQPSPPGQAYPSFPSTGARGSTQFSSIPANLSPANLSSPARGFTTQPQNSLPSTNLSSTSLWSGGSSRMSYPTTNFSGQYTTLPPLSSSGSSGSLPPIDSLGSPLSDGLPHQHYPSSHLSTNLSSSGGGLGIPGNSLPILPPVQGLGLNPTSLSAESN